MAGGNGTRLWPKSQADLPKQFFPFMDGESMFQKTISRLEALLPRQDIYVVTIEEYVPYVREQANLPVENIIVEPEPKDTAACIGLVAVRFLEQELDPVLITLPSDHYIDDEMAFRNDLLTAYRQALQVPGVVTLGIKPNRPETAYGYIKVAAGAEGNVLPVDKFTEKPDLQTAKQWVKMQDYFWNSGIFVWKASVIFSLIEKYMPNLAARLRKIQSAIGSTMEQKILRQEYAMLPKISIDYGVLEKAECTYLIPGSFVWDDLGNWTALERIVKKDHDGNVVVGEHRLLNTRNCIVYSETAVVGVIGVEDLIITVADNAVLICHKDREQEIKKLILRNTIP
jgi:mannose-1-phosphate guanylyltransferase